MANEERLPWSYRIRTLLHVSDDHLNDEEKETRLRQELEEPVHESSYGANVVFHHFLDTSPESPCTERRLVPFDRRQWEHLVKMKDVLDRRRALMDQIHQLATANDEAKKTLEALVRHEPVKPSALRMTLDGGALAGLAAITFKDDGPSESLAVKLYAMSQLDARQPYMPICPAQTPEACRKARETVAKMRYKLKDEPSDWQIDAAVPCEDTVHFQPVICMDTDPGLGDCVFLDACPRQWRGCRYVHYERLLPRTGASVLGIQMLKQTKWAKKNDVQLFDQMSPEQKEAELEALTVRQREWARLGPFKLGNALWAGRQPDLPHWHTTDLYAFDFNLLGEFRVIVVAPVWPEHPKPPYQTTEEQALRSMSIGNLGRDALLYLWVSQDSLAFGRNCLKSWGFLSLGEVTWIKTDQMDYVTMRKELRYPAFWANHAREFCLVGIKGEPVPFTTFTGDQATKTIVAPKGEKRSKPAEFYDMIDFLAGASTRKIEVFGQARNERPGWTTLGHTAPCDPTSLNKEKEDTQAKPAKKTGDGGKFSWSGKSTRRRK
ncbi:MAG: hypothetical protein M1838_005828 [Thelocarpon superellum]|nr:MAG: hypothetical protein M1838_005828 [Thelocarpon superellum]